MNDSSDLLLGLVKCWYYLLNLGRLQDCQEWGEDGKKEKFCFGHLKSQIHTSLYLSVSSSF